MVRIRITVSAALFFLALNASAMSPKPVATDADSYFPASYEASRARFREHIARGPHPADRHGSFAVPSKVYKDLSVDWAHFKAKKPKTLVVLMSGVHGPESFGSSAVQAAAFERLLPRASAETGFLFVHAMNPYGFKSGRRVTEHNIDLNRNFGIDDSLFDNKNPGYFKIRDLFEPQGRVIDPNLGLFGSAAKVFEALALKRMSFDDFNEAYGNGQYESARGVGYGGRALEPQIGFFRKLLESESRDYESVVFFDLHTGLGEKGQLHVITGMYEKLCDPGLIEAALKRHPHPESFELTTPDSQGFYASHGDSADFAPQLLAGVGGKRVLSATMEFGTLGKDVPSQLQSLNRIVLENQGFWFGYATPWAKPQVQREFAELFNPHDARWRAAVIDKGTLFLQGVLERVDPGFRP